jgi:hypothetical protein
MNEDKKKKRYVSVCSIALFLLSLTQKSYCTSTQCGDSIMVFLLGWAAVFSGGAGIAWFANPLLIASWITLKKNLKASMFLAVFSCLLSLSFLLAGSIIDNEGGQPHPIVSYQTGYWLWAGSTITMVFGTFILMLRQNTRNARK